MPERPYTAATNCEGIEDYVEEVPVRPLQGAHFLPEAQPDVIDAQTGKLIGSRVPAPA